MCLQRIQTIAVFNRFWIMLEQILWKMKFNQCHSLFLELKPFVCNFIFFLSLGTDNKWADTCLCDFAQTSYWRRTRCHGFSPPNGFGKPTFGKRHWRAVVQGFCSPLDSASWTLLHFSPAGFWEQCNLEDRVWRYSNLLFTLLISYSIFVLDWSNLIAFQIVCSLVIRRFCQIALNIQKQTKTLVQIRAYAICHTAHEVKVWSSWKSKQVQML